MKILNLLSSGTVGGIEVLCKNIGEKANYYNSFCFLFSEGKIYEEMKTGNITVISLVNASSKKKITLNKVKQLKNIAKQHDIIVTHHANIPSQLIYYILRHVLKRKKYVMVVHSCFESNIYYNYSSRFRNKLFAFLLKNNLNKSDGIIFVSEAGKRSYQDEFGLRDKQLRVIYNGVPFEDNNVKFHSEKRDSSIINILYVGRLVEVKGVQLLIDAIDKMIKSRLDCKLRIVGDGSYRGELEKLVIERNLTKHVSFEGQQRDVDKYYEDADIFVYPSVWQEVFGISIVEAMSAGIPCVAFNVGGIPEIIIDGKNGALAYEKNGEALKNAIVKVRKAQEENMCQIRQNCIDTAKKFSIYNTINELEDFYNKLL